MKRFTIAIATLAVIAIAVTTLRHSRHPDVREYITWLKGAENQRQSIQMDIDSASNRMIHELNTATDAKTGIDAADHIHIPIDKLSDFYDVVAGRDPVPAPCAILHDRFKRVFAVEFPTDRPDETGEERAARVAAAAKEADESLTEVCKEYGLVKEFEIRAD